MEENTLKGILANLSEKERIMLAALHESELRPVLEKALVSYQRHQAAWVLANSPSHEYTLSRRGVVEGARFVIDLAHKAYKQEQTQDSKVK